MAGIYIRQAKERDLVAIMQIIGEAKQLLKQEGSPQWQDGNPNEEVLIADIASGCCYVLICGKRIAGTATLLEEKEKNYAKIEAGSWLNENIPYTTIHRIAISAEYRGRQLGQYFFSNLISLSVAKGFSQVRIDTHELNVRMQHYIKKFDFSYRGIVYVTPDENGKRLAYEWNG